MHILRIFSLWLLRLLCIASVSGSLYLVTISTTILDRGDVKEWLGASGIYKDGALISALFAEQPEAPTSPNNIPTEQTIISSSAITNALIRTFPTSFLKQSFNSVIDKSYDWMEGESTNFSFSIPINAQRQTFINELITEVEPKIATLPLCTAYSTALCRPASITTPGFTRQLVTDSFASSDFLQTPITEKSFSSATSGSEQVSLSKLPMLRKTIGLLLWILPVLSIISLVGALLLTKPSNRLTLTSKLSRAIFSNMTLAVLFSGAIIIVEKFHGLPLEAVLPKAGALTPIMAQFITELILAFSWSLLFIAAYLLTISLLIWVTLVQFKKHRTPPYIQPNTPTPPPLSA